MLENTVSWQSRAAAIAVATLSVLILMMAGGHFYGVMTAAQNRPLDFRLASLIATSGILAYPGLLGLVVCRWLWLGRDWAYGMGIFSALAPFGYLVLLLRTDTLDPTKVGSELGFAAIVVAVYILVIGAAWVSLRMRASHVEGAAA